MADPELNDDEKIVSGGTLRVRHFVIIAVIAIVIVAFYLWIRSVRMGPGEGPPEGVAEVPEGSRAVTLYFADKENETLLTETRLVAIGKELVEQIEQVMRALLDGPEEGGVSTIAQGTRLLNAFYDSETSTLYLDFSSELVAGHPGGSSAEYYTIAALIRTVSENFPEVQAVQILVEGLQVGTIAGHIDAYKPFLVRDWR
ncbi:MAG: GerMN domain-containing protein [Candidatus Latescibacterota bacterium]|nr:MAG: GerMN domain-containing protein [Candidatus Latescibacterota bacterium]